MVSRRTVLRGALAALPLSLLWKRPARAAGFGALVPDPYGILDLPPGFTYTIVERGSRVLPGGDVRRFTMSDGHFVPGRADGMACFAGPNGTLVLMRNHELNRDASHLAVGPYAVGTAAPAQAYDAGDMGCVTRVVVDARTLERVSSNLVVAGTRNNCCGGLSPGGWMTCEEVDVAAATDADPAKQHGYVFFCPSDSAGLVEAQPIKAYGRFEHEACHVDPTTMIAYMTEDTFGSCFYRFKPTSPAAQFVGTLQALKIPAASGNPTESVNTQRGFEIGQTWPVSWVTIDDPDPQNVGGGPLNTTRAQGAAKGAATFARGEGLWLHDKVAYFTATSGGPVERGQIFRLDVDGDGGTLTLVAQSTDERLHDMPDNITLAPWGDVFICEDGGNNPEDQYIRILHADRTVTEFARNVLSSSEMTGACFSPDGKVLFLNIQVEGLTLAITGPFPVDEPMPMTPDAGVPMTPDAGMVPPPDAGGGNPGDGDGDEGCGCDASSQGGVGTAVLAVATAAAIGLRGRSDSSES